MRRKTPVAAFVVVFFWVFLIPAFAQFSQQGPKLVGTGTVGSANQGWSVSLSADGNTAIVGGYYETGNAGAAWVYTRNGGTWTQQGNKLVGSGAVGNARQGWSVSLSADGNTAIVGGPEDDDGAGATWVFTRGGGLWTQQGQKLVGGVTLAGWGASQGWSVSLSADGNTAIVGGPGDNRAVGAAWVWTRSGGVWTQQGDALVGSGAVGNSNQGNSVSLSADSNTAIIGGVNDNDSFGAAWIWTRSGGVWTQQGSKLVGSGWIKHGDLGPWQGCSVALSADGNTAIVGGYYDNNGEGAAWVWTRSGGVWTQQGAKLVGADGTAIGSQGSSVSLSANGNTAIVGGPADDGGAGAAWAWTRSGGVWTQQGAKLVGSGSGSVYASQGSSVTLSADGNTAIVGGPGDDYCAGAAWVFVTAECTGLSIAGQPQSQTIRGGQTATLAVTAAGNEPLSYQWYQGSSGTTITPVGTNSNTFTTPSLTTTTSYWVLVANSCGQANSDTATINVVNPPTISLINKVAPPFKIVVTGSNLQNGIKVYINGSSTAWSPVVWKSATQVVIKGGAALKAAVPANTPTNFTFVNPDGGSVTKTWQWP